MKDYFRIDELSSLLGVHHQTIRRWCRENTIPYYNIGRAYRFNKEEIAQWVKSQKGGMNNGSTN